MCRLEWVEANKTDHNFKTWCVRHLQNKLAEKTYFPIYPLNTNYNGALEGQHKVLGWILYKSYCFRAFTTEILK